MSAQHDTPGAAAALGTPEQRRNPFTERSIDGKTLLVLEATDAGTCASHILDARDAGIVSKRLALMDAITGPRVGDFVRFADGVERRVSYHWKDDEGWDGGLQTSDASETLGFHLSSAGVCSFSGGLRSAIPIETFTQLDETQDGTVWIFHHDQAQAHNGVYVRVPFRVFACSLAANR